MFDPATATFLEGGCALIVGTVGPDGDPYATRGWGLTLLDGGHARLVLPEEDTVARENLAAGAPIAITAADVPTLRSLQLKGRSLGVEPATDDDRERAARYADSFFADLVEADRMTLDEVGRLLPRDFTACVVTIEHVYDQTPGPGAGAQWTASG